jgi:hypothetical protein
MHDQTTGTLAIKTANVVTQAAAAGTVYFGLTLNEIGVIIGMFVAVIGLIGQLGLTWYYKHQHLELARQKRAADNDQ